jgi:hypothetical protein
MVIREGLSGDDDNDVNDGKNIKTVKKARYGGRGKIVCV